MINIFQPSLDVEELGAVESVFKSNWIGKGDSVHEFEKQFAFHLNTDNAHLITTTSCTEAIFLASDIFDYTYGDEIIAPSISFVAVGNSVINKGANLVLCDVDKHTLNVRAEDIEKKITPNTKAVILTHYGGCPCEMDDIIDLCKDHDIYVIEDTACATKSFYNGKACGTIGDMGMWSFGAMKVICTGDGGIIHLKSKELLATAHELIYHGFPKKLKSGMDNLNAGNLCWWEYDVIRPGRRATMNNVSGAIGVEQLKKLDSFISRKRAIYETYCQELSQLQWLTIPPPLSEKSISSYYFFWLQLDKRDKLAQFLLMNGVYSTFRYWPLHKIELFKQKGAQLPNADYASQRTLNIPLHQNLSDDDVNKVITLIKDFGKLYM